jgi:hypothetical protein
MIARRDFTQQISKKAAIGGLRTKNYSNEAFPEVVRVTFPRAAAATPSCVGRVEVIARAGKY